MNEFFYKKNYVIFLKRHLAFQAPNLHMVGGGGSTSPHQSSSNNTKEGEVNIQKKCGMMKQQQCKARVMHHNKQQQRKLKDHNKHYQHKVRAMNHNKQQHKTTNYNKQQ